jgi:outer membrane protein TolC
MQTLRHEALILASVVLASVPVAAHAQPTESDPELGALYIQGGLTADSAAARARVASPAVWRKVAELETAIANVDAAKLARVPVVTTKLSYTRLSSIDSANIAALGNITFPSLLDNYTAQTQVVVPLSDYVLRHPGSIKAARLGADAARTNKLASELGAANAARHAYYEWIRARLQLAISRRQLAQVHTNLAQVQAIVAIGRLPRADLLRIESQEAEIEQLVDKLSTVAELREEMLRVQIGARPDEPLAIGEDIRTAIIVPPSATLDDLSGLAVAQRLDFRALSLGIEANEQRRLAERANALPKLSAFATSDYSNPSQRVFPQTDKFTWTWSAGVQLTWSLNDTLVSHTTQHRLAAEANELRVDREQLSRDTRIAVSSAQHDIANAQRALESTRKGLVAAEEGYRVRRALLDAQRVTAVELVDAETELTRARISALDARIDLRIAIAELDHALGNDR